MTTTRTSSPALWRTLIGALLVASIACLPLFADDGEERAPVTSLLEHYVHAPDATYEWELIRTTEGEGFKYHLLRMVSGTWLTKDDVNRTEWWHWMRVVVPDEIKHKTALLYISGGSNRETLPGEDANPLLLGPALSTGTIAVELNMVPNQPLGFTGDDAEKRTEDSLIAYGWEKFLLSGARDQDAEWLARFPMTRAAVRGMDATVEFAASEAAGGHQVTGFVVAGGSKRGWTTWTTGLVDSRVRAIAPIVIDMLNVIPSFEHHWQAYGFWAPAVWDYKNQGIMNWTGTPEYKRLTELVDPYSFRERLTLPKMVINATGDQFFLPDSSQFYWDGLVGPKLLRYVPNSEHSMEGTDVAETFLSFYQSIVLGRPLPALSWKIEGDRLIVSSEGKERPIEAQLWSAHNPKTRDFRVDTIRRTWEPTKIEAAADGTFAAVLEDPKEGYRAYLIEVTFEGPQKVPFKLSTGVTVRPEVLPFPPRELSSERMTSEE